MQQLQHSRFVLAGCSRSPNVLAKLLQPAGGGADYAQASTSRAAGRAILTHAPVAGVAPVAGRPGIRRTAASGLGGAAGAQGVKSSAGQLAARLGATAAAGGDLTAAQYAGGLIECR